MPAAASAEAHLRHITSKPHVAGTPGDFEMAEYVRAQMASYGLDSRIENVTAWLSYPAAPPRLALIREGAGETPIELAEPVLASDRTSDTAWRNLTFHAYSPSGDVTGSLVYANYGRVQDFEALRSLGVDVAGKVVLARYTRGHRGLKVRNAQANGAAAVILYPDPEDDGYVQGKPYPDGPWRAASSVVRGNVQFNTLCSGDPTRAAGPRSVEELCGYRTEDLIPRIPSIPLSYGSARALLEMLGGRAAPREFQGGLPLNYTVGPSGYALRLRTRHTAGRVPIPNVITTITGSGARERPVILGNHRDAWAYGAADPNSGTASLLELARGFGELRRAGWRPERSIVLCSWSGEEFGLLGSTAWAELNEPLVSKAVAYLNVDTAVQGDQLAARGTFALRPLLESALGVVEAPGGGRLELGSAFTPIGAMSDYTAFVHHFGVATVDFGFVRIGATGRRARYGAYHSVYDSFDWMSSFGAGGAGAGVPGRAFELMRASARLWGVLALRLADARVLPFNHSAQADALEAWRAALTEESGLDTSALEAAVRAYAAAAARLPEAAAPAAASAPEEGALAALNDRLAFTERRFLAEEGLPNRRWWRHRLQATDMDEGYSPLVFPGVRDALKRRSYEEARGQLQLLAESVQVAAAYLAGVMV